MRARCLRTLEAKTSPEFQHAKHAITQCLDALKAPDPCKYNIYIGETCATDNACLKEWLRLKGYRRVEFLPRTLSGTLTAPTRRVYMAVIDLTLDY